MEGNIIITDKTVLGEAACIADEKKTELPSSSSHVKDSLGTALQLNFPELYIPDYEQCIIDDNEDTDLQAKLDIRDVTPTVVAATSKSVRQEQDGELQEQDANNGPETIQPDESAKSNPSDEDDVDDGENDVNNEVDERIVAVLEEVDGTKMRADQLRTYLEERTRQAEKEDDKEEQELNVYGLISRVDVPVRQTQLRLDPLLMRRNELLDMRAIMEKNRSELLDLTLPKPRFARSKRSHTASGIEQQQQQHAERTPATTKLEGSAAFNVSVRDSTRNALSTDYGRYNEAKIKRAREGLEYERQKLQARRKEPRKHESQVMKADDRSENEELLKRMRRKLNFMRNKRFEQSGNRIALPATSAAAAAASEGRLASEATASADLDAAKEQQQRHRHAVLAQPSAVEFVDYRVGETYEVSVRIVNPTPISRRFRVLPPALSVFNVSQIQYPTQDDGLIAPGMCTRVKVLFRPDCLDDFRDAFVVCTETTTVRVPIIAYREPPKLSLSDTLDCGSCLVDDCISVVFHCHNSGGDGSFHLQHSLDPADKTEPQSTAVTVGPFEVSPSSFRLRKSESLELVVRLAPSEAGTYRETLSVVCGNGQTRRIELRGQAWRPCVRLHSIDTHPVQGDVHDIVRALVFEQRVTARGQQCKTFALENTTPIDLPFYFIWRDLQQQQRDDSDERKGPNESRQVHAEEEEDDAAPVGRSRRPSVDARLPSSSQAPFDVRPGLGRLPAFGVVPFTVSFRPPTPCLYRSSLQLVLEDVPRSSAECSSVRGRTGWPQQRVDSDCRRDIAAVEFLDIDVVGEGVGCRVKASPLLVTLPKDVVLQEDASASFKLINHGHSPTAFTWRRPLLRLRHASPTPTDEYEGGGSGASTERSLSTRTSTARNHSDSAAAAAAAAAAVKNNEVAPSAHILRIEPERGHLDANESIEVTIHARIEDVGRLEALLICDIELGDSVQVRFVASSYAPRLRIAEPVIDFGLLNLGSFGTRRSRTLHLHNPTCVPLSFAMAVAEPSCTSGTDATARPRAPAPAPAPAFISDDGQRSVRAPAAGGCNRSLTWNDAPEIRFAPSVGVVPPFGSSAVVTTLAPRHCQRLRSVLVCHVKGGEPCFVSARAEVQAPQLAVLDAVTELSDVFVRVPFRFTIRIRNLTNLVAQYAFEQRRTEHYELSTSPDRGALDGKDELQVTVHMTALKAGKLDAALSLDVEGLSTPLGYRVVADVGDLVVSCHLRNEELPQPHLHHLIDEALSISVHQRSNDPGDLLERRQRELGAQLDQVVPFSDEVPNLEYGKCVPIYEHCRKRVLLRNHSAVPAQYKVCMDASNVDSDVGVEELIDEMRALASDATSPSAAPVTESDMNGSAKNWSRQTAASGQLLSRSRRSHAFEPSSWLQLRNEHEALCFQSENGRAFVQARKRRDKVRQLLKGKGGIFVASPRQGALPPWATVELDVFCFNDMCGCYRDTMRVQVEGLARQEFALPLSATVVGSPLSFSSATVGIRRDAHGRSCIDFVPVPTASGRYSRRIRIENQGSFDIKLHWRLYDSSELSDDLVDVRIDVNDQGVARCSLLPLEAQPASDFSRFPFELTPAWVLVPAHGHSHITLSFEAPTQLASLAGFIDSLMYMRDLDSSVISAPSAVDMHNDNSTEREMAKGWSLAPALLRSNALQMHFSASTFASRLTPLKTRPTRFVLSPETYVAPHANAVPSRGNSLKTIPAAGGIGKSRNASASTSSIIRSANNDKQRGALKRWIVLNNSTPSPLSFTATAEPKSLFTVTQVKVATSRLSRSGFSRVAAGESTSICVEARTPSPRNLSIWPMQARTLLPGRVFIRFDNGTEQCLDLMAELKRPVLTLDPIHTIVGPTHVNSEMNVVVSLSNVSEVPCHWRIVHIARLLADKKHSSIVPEDLKNFLYSEFDVDADAIDDITVWKFDTGEGTVRPLTLPQTVAAPGSGYVAYDKTREPLRVNLRFCPTLNRVYFSRFRVEVLHGAPVDFTVAGQGSYLEEHNRHSLINYSNSTMTQRRLST